jgi:hypothetical protein
MMQDRGRIGSREVEWRDIDDGKEGKGDVLS